MQKLHHLRHDAADPLWPDRDRVLCTAAGPEGPGMTLAGPPGLAFGAALGLALAERLLAARFGRSLVDHRTWLIADAGELEAGTAYEAAAIAGALNLGRLAVVAAVPEARAPALARFVAMGWTVRRVPAAAPEDVHAALAAAMRAQKPTLVALLTDNGDGAAHDVMAALSASPQTASARRSWLKRLRRHGAGAAFQQAFGGAVAPRLPALPTGSMAPGMAPGMATGTDNAASAVLPGEALNALFHRAITLLPEIALLPPPSPAQAAGIAASAGPAGLAASTSAPAQAPWLPTRPDDAADPAADPVWHARYQASSAALLGMALHGGLLPVGRFPQEAADAIRPVERAAALLGQRLIHIVTGCNPGLANSLHEAGRAIANLSVYYPADAAEAIECAGLALRRSTGPSTLILTDVQAPCPEHKPIAGSAKGGYTLVDDPGAVVTLIASGPAVSQALAVRAVLAARGVAATVASIPCWDAFFMQPVAYRAAVMGDVVRVTLVAGSGGLTDAALRPGDLSLDLTNHDDPMVIAAQIERHLARRPGILEDSENLLETAPDMD